MPNKYSTALRAIDSLQKEDLQSIVKLYLSYYDGTDEVLVLSDLQKKTNVLMLYHDEVLVGFTTFEVYEKVWQGKVALVVYSGDTIVEKAHWGQQALAYAWIRYIGELKRENPAQSIYWFLIVKGHRTFKYLPAFTHTFYPHWSSNEQILKPLLDSLAKEKFGDDYDAQSGIISFKHSRGHLKEAFSYPQENEMNNLSVKYFLEKNPGYLRGDELACICSFEDDNLRPFTKRVLYGKRGVA